MRPGFAHLASHIALLKKNIWLCFTNRVYQLPSCLIWCQMLIICFFSSMNDAELTNFLRDCVCYNEQILLNLLMWPKLAQEVRLILSAIPLSLESHYHSNGINYSRWASIYSLEKALGPKRLLPLSFQWCNLMHWIPPIVCFDSSICSPSCLHLKSVVWQLNGKTKMIKIYSITNTLPILCSKVWPEMRLLACKYQLNQQSLHIVTLQRNMPKS